MQLQHHARFWRAATCAALAVFAASCSSGANPTPGHGTSGGSGASQGTGQSGHVAATGLDLHGTYTFGMRVDGDGACNWPVKTFIWPVKFVASTAAQGQTIGSVVFPPTASAPTNSWSITAAASGISLVPGEKRPGPAAAAYNLVVDGGRWEAGPPTRAFDGRGEITNGTATGARLVLVLPGSDKEWECGSDATWSLLARWIDTD